MELDDATFQVLSEKRGWTPEQEEKARSIISKISVDDELTLSEKVRGFAGISMESSTAGILGDEFRAAGRAGIAVLADGITGNDYAGSFGEEYKVALQDEREVERKVYEEYPVSATAAQITFGLLPAAKIGAAVGVGKSALAGAARQGGAAAAEGALYGFLEGEGAEGRLKGAASGAVIGGGLGAAGGAVAGKFAARAAAREAGEEAATKAAAAKQESMLNPKTVDDEMTLVNEARTQMDAKALSHLQTTGKALSGDTYKAALRETAQTLGVPMRRVRQAQAETGEFLNYQGKTSKELFDQIDDWVPGSESMAKAGAAKQFWRDHVTPIVKKAETVVGKEFGGQMQSYATKMAKAGDNVTGLFTNKAVQAFQRTVDADGSGEIRQALLNMSNVHLERSERKTWEKALITKLVKSEDKDTLAGYLKIRQAIRDQQIANQKYVNAHMQPDDLYWHAQPKSKEVSVKGHSGLQGAMDASAKLQQRGAVSAKQAMEIYENPTVAIDDWLRTTSATSEMMRHFNLRNLVTKRMQEAAAQGKTYRPNKKQIAEAQKEQAAGHYMFTELRDSLMQRGADEKTAQHAEALMRSVVIEGSKGPNQIISNIRKAAYMGTIGNPYSAVLNTGDVFNSMVNFGAGNTVKALRESFQRGGFDVTVDDVGLMHQATGEFVRDGLSAAQNRFNKLSEASFKYSGFRGIDRWGKNVAINAALKDNEKLAKQGYETFAKRWKGVFTEAETKKLHKDVLQGNKSDNVTEMAAAELAKMQPTDAANLPQWFLEHPNGRIFYMLRTFGLKQLQQMQNLVYDQFKAGNKKEAFKNAMAYTMVVGGGNAAVNESRQVMKLEKPTLKGYGMRFTDHMLGAATANMISTYSYGRAINEKNPLHLVNGALPPLAIVAAPIVDLGVIAQNAPAKALYGSPLLAADEISNVDFKEAIAESETFGWLPWGRLAQEWMQ